MKRLPHPLATSQPAADPARLPVPAVISANPGWFNFPLIVVVIWIGLMLGLFVWFWPADGPFMHLLELSLGIALPLSGVAQLTMYR